MAAKIGILGETTVVTGGETTTTVYTVPADKAARVRILWLCETGSDTFQAMVMIGTPGTDESWHIGDVAAATDVFTGLAFSTDKFIHTDDALERSVAGIDMTSAGSSGEHMTFPFSKEYFLATGDTVRIRLKSGAVADVLFQVHGVEDDA